MIPGREIKAKGDESGTESGQGQKILLKNLESGEIIGNIVFGSDKNSDEFDCYIRLSDGSQIKLSECIIGLNKILNLKFQLTPYPSHK